MLKKIATIGLGLVAALALFASAPARAVDADYRYEIPIFGPVSVASGATSTAVDKGSTTLDTSRYIGLQIAAMQTNTGAGVARTVTINCHSVSGTKLYNWDAVTLTTNATGNLIVMSEAYVDPDNTTTAKTATAAVHIPYRPCSRVTVTLGSGNATTWQVNGLLPATK